MISVKVDILGLIMYFLFVIFVGQGIKKEDMLKSKF